MINIDNKKAISEINEILSQLDDEALKRLPEKLLDEFSEKACLDVSYIEPDISLEDLKLEQETKEILALISYNYFCDEDEKKKWNEKFSENEIKYQKEINEKYNPDNLFKTEKKENNIKSENNETEMVVHKENFFKKIFNFIKRFFKA